MSPRLELALKETLEIIDKRILDMTQEGDIMPEPEVIELEDSILIHYFKNWNKYNELVLEKIVNVDASDLLSSQIFFIPKNGIIEDDNKYVKTILCLEGGLKIIDENDEKTVIGGLAAKDIKSGKYHITGLKDSFVLLILR
jgi:hypothetical protein